MNKKIAWFLMCFLVAPLVSYAYVTLQSYSTGEVLTSSKLNSNQNSLNTGLDNLQQEMKDSLAAVDVRVNEKFLLASFDDSIETRYDSQVIVPWSLAYGDSFYAGDSLTVQISRSNPIGTMPGLFVQNACGATTLPEKVKMVITWMLPNPISKLDSIQTQVWTERTNGDDFAALYVYDDSTNYLFKSFPTDSSGVVYSATARTAKYMSIKTPNITGGKIRIETVVQSKNSDSLFVGPLNLFVTNR